MKLEANFGVCLHIEGKPDMAWDKLEIQQSIKEQTLEASATQDISLLKLAEDAEPDAEPDMAVNVGPSCVEDAPKKKSRRRPRHRKKKIAAATTESTVPDEAVGESQLPDLPPPVPRAQSPRFPVKPLKIVSALPDEFYPVELSDDLFAPEPEKDEPEEDEGDR